MIRDVVVHIANEQPILVDLVFEPAPADVALICRNLRLMNGKKPVFIDKIDSTFVISLSQVRFVEMPRTSMEACEAEKLATAAAAKAASAVDQEDSSEAPTRLADRRRLHTGRSPRPSSCRDRLGGGAADRGSRR